MQVITHEVIRKNEIVYINFLFLNLSNILLILFTISGHECMLRLQRQVQCSWSNDGEFRFCFQCYGLSCRNLIQWLTPEQWINMTNMWQHFPREVARIAAIEETSPFVY